MASSAEQVKEKLNIVEVVSGYVTLQKAGQNFKAKCPFHNERTPSFSVSPSRGAYYCFGCGEKGDMFTFVERMEGIDFKGALKLLADKAGVVIRYEPKEASDRRERLYRLLEAAAVFYEKNLESHATAKEYLASRGAAPAILARFRVGYARPEWRGVIDHLGAYGYTEKETVAAGLGKEIAAPRGTRVYDRFRGRIMFPIADPGGRVVGFSGRFFERMPGKEDATEPAKYINSPETEMYHKSRILFGYDIAKTAMRKADFAILVEGQMDLLLSHQAGFPNTVALSGTALTGEHLSLIARMTKRLVLALDADAAGVRSVGRGAHLALRAGFDLKVAELEGGKDPADIVASGAEGAVEYRRIIRESVHIVDFFLTLLKKEYGEGRPLIQAVEKTVLPYIAEIESPLDRAHFIKRTADAVGLSEAAVLESLERAEGTQKTLDMAVPETEPASKKLLRKERIIELLFGLFEWLHRSYAGEVEAVRSRTEKLLGDAFDHFASMHNAQKEALAFAAESTHEGEAQGLRHLEELVVELEKAVIKEELEATLADLRLAEHAKDGERVKELLSKSHELSKRLNAL